MKTTFPTRAAGAVLIPLMMFGASAALADPEHSDLPEFGQAGDVSHIDQVIEVDMGEMYFTPDNYSFERGETVKFVLKNTGRAVHEFAIGTEETQKAHEQEMKAMRKAGMITTSVLRHDRMLEAGMMHVDANSRLLAPDEASELVWTFSGEQEELIIACNVPGHRAAGMEATVTIGDDHAS